MRNYAVGLAIIAFCSTAWARQYIICIDPGHGGKDSGAVGCGLQEKDVVLKVGKMLNSILQADPDFNPIMTRSTDVFIPLLTRSDYANSHNADRFVSIHNNAGGGTGTETYCYRDGSNTSFDQRDKIQAEMLKAWHLTDRHGKTAGYSVLRHTHMPSTLSELAFIDTCSPDAKYLSSEQHLREAAEAHHIALRKSLGLSGSSPPPNPTHKGLLEGVVYEDTGTGTGDTSHRLTGATVRVQGNGVDTTTTAAGTTAHWEFTLEVGNYTVTASLQDYKSASRQCTVTDGGDTWCSIGLVRQTTSSTGVIKGVVYEDQGNSNLDKRLPGAHVIASGQGVNRSTVASVPSALWSFELAPGTYTIEASMTGFHTSSRVCKAVANQESWCSIGLKKDVVQPKTGDIKGLIYDAVLGQGYPLGGMQVDINGNGVHNTTYTDSSSGNYSFSGLNPGVYTIVASGSGYISASMQCEVEAGLTKWCSMGLYKQNNGGDEDTGQSDPGTGWKRDIRTDNGYGFDTGYVYDTGRKKDLSNYDNSGYQTDYGHGKDTAYQSDRGYGQDYNQGNDNTLSLGDTLPNQGPDMGGPNGCNTGNDSHMAFPGIFLLLLIFFWPWRRRSLTIFLVVGGLVFTMVSCSNGDGITQGGKAIRTQGIAVYGLHRLTTKGDWTMPVFSPDGTKVSFTTPNLNRLYVTDLKTSETRLITTGHKVGYKARWLPNNTGLALRLPEQPTWAIPGRSILLNGKSGPVPRNPTPGIHVLVDDDQVYVMFGRKRVRISPPNDRYCCIVRSSDGQKVAFLGLSTGLYIYDMAKHKTLRIGMGNHPSFSGNGGLMVYDQCLDNGDRITSCRLKIAVLNGPLVHTYTIYGVPPMSMYPNISRDGSQIVFESKGSIWTARLH